MRSRQQSTQQLDMSSPAIEASGAAQAAMLAEKLSAVKRGLMLRLSVAGSADGSIVPVSSPRQRGEYATIPTPSSRAQGTTASVSEVRTEAARKRCTATCVLRVPCADTPFYLNGSHWSDGVEPPELCWSDLAQSDVLDEPLALQATSRHGWQLQRGARSALHLELLHAAGNVLDGHLGAHPVHVIKIHVPATEPLERLGQLLPDAGKCGAVGHARRHEFGCDD